MSKAEKLHSQIIEMLDAGRSVTFATYTNATRVTPKTYKKWQKDGLELFRVEGDHLCIASGKKFVSVMGCKITAA